MDKFEQKEMKKIRPIKNTWYDCLIDYIPESIRRSVGGFKIKIVNIFKTNTPKQTAYEGGKKLSKSKTQNIRNPPFILKKKKLSDEGYSLEVDVQYPEKLHELHNDLSFLPERMKIEKVEKLVTNLHEKFKASIKSWINFEKSS